MIASPIIEQVSAVLLSAQHSTQPCDFVSREAQKRGWELSYASDNNSLVKKADIGAVFPLIKVIDKLPSFLLARNGIPVGAIYVGDELVSADDVNEKACGCADKVNRLTEGSVKFAIGVSKTKEGEHEVAILFKSPQGVWRPLVFANIELTAMPTIDEIDFALQANDATTIVSLPSKSDYIDASTQLNGALKQASVDVTLRPLVISAIAAAMHEGKVQSAPKSALASVNDLMSKAINGRDDISVKRKKRVIKSLTLSGGNFNKLSPFVGRIVAILDGMNIKAVLETDTEFMLNLLQCTPSSQT